jgi:hypothetical protein
VTAFLDGDGPEAPPRRNGEVVFEAPWQGRAFGLTAAVVQTRFGGDRELFRQRLIEAIAADPERPYWESWVVALEAIVAHEGLVTADELEAALTGTDYPA